jgi:hypothetical protein
MIKEKVVANIIPNSKKGVHLVPVFLSLSNKKPIVFITRDTAKIIL